uniref:Uncharacterized protein n=1 Tax=Physcomitrium patens TaxID=3218 RepID=A0A2K1IXN8_PHYPA|nr:hypothetical protein PHYPA_023854 [Physcomitrium patens]
MGVGVGVEFFATSEKLFVIVNNGI